MDQINPLAELTHKRRLSALGLVVSAATAPALKSATFTPATTDAFARLKLRKDPISV